MRRFGRRGRCWSRRGERLHDVGCGCSNVVYMDGVLTSILALIWKRHCTVFVSVTHVSGKDRLKISLQHRIVSGNIIYLHLTRPSSSGTLSEPCQSCCLYHD